MKKAILGALTLLVVMTGCAVTDYPTITDDRGSFSGIIRTGHKAYINVTSSVATLWDDGSDELFSMVSQNNYGDQHIYTFNNFDPTSSIMFLDQTYCDWRYEGCEITRSSNPHNDAIDNQFDYEFFPDCSGARSLSMLVADSGRVGECGDAGLWASKQNLAAEFANLSTATWRGGNAYVVPMNSSNTQVTLNGYAMPMYGQFTGFVTEKLQLVVPMTPNARHELSFLRNWVNENGSNATLGVTYGSLNGSFNMRFAPAGISYNLNRF